MEEEIYKETLYSKVQIENQSTLIWKTIKDQKLQGCCFKKRVADFFLIGMARAYASNVLPKLLIKDDKKKSDAFNIALEVKGSKRRSLVDREEFWNLFRVLAYSHQINQAGNNRDSKKWKESHFLLTNGQYCTRLAEEYFKGGWTTPVDDSFHQIVEREIPDDNIMEELLPYLVLEEDEEEFEDLE